MKAAWTGWGLSGEPRPSAVVTCLPAASEIFVTQDRACTVLAQAAAELGGVQAQVVAQGVEQRHVAVPGLDRPGGSIDDELKAGHRGLLTWGASLHAGAGSRHARGSLQSRSIRGSQRASAPLFRPGRL